LPSELFVGALSSYYDGAWREPDPHLPEPRRRAQDVELVRVFVYTAGDPPVEKVQPDRRPEIEAWRDRLNVKFAPTFAGPLEWDEGADRSVVGKPDMQTLQLWIASIDRPEHARQWNRQSIVPADVTSSDMRARFSHIFSPPGFWLPAEFDFLVEADDPLGRPTTLGSTSSVLRQLEELNALSWQATAEEIEDWGLTLPGTEAPLEKAARHSFYEFYACAKLAVGHRLPMTLDIAPKP
jgi:hypothetical protein